MRSHSGILAAAEAIDPASLSPTAYYKASAGYGVDGAARFGFNPTNGAQVINALTSSAAGFATGATSWGVTMMFSVAADTGGVQALCSKDAAGNFEFELYYDNAAGKIALVIYDQTAASQVILTSTVVIAFGTTYVVSAGNSGGTLAYLRVNNETTVTAAVAFTAGSGTAPFKIGAYYSSNSHFFTGTIDSLGFAAGYAFTSADMTAFYNGGAGVRWQDLSGARQAHFLSWYDFGNQTVNDSINHTTMDYLLDSTAHGNALSTIGNNIPYCLPGLVAPTQTSDSTNTALWIPDSGANGNYAIQPYYTSRFGYANTGMGGKPSFFFNGTRNIAFNTYDSSWVASYLAGPSFSGTNHSWSACCKFQTLSLTQLGPNPGDTFLGQTLCGLSTMGYVPWHGDTTSLGPSTALDRIVWILHHDTPQETDGKWNSIVQDDAGLSNYGANGALTLGVHAAVVVFDGSTATTTLYIDGSAVSSLSQPNDNENSPGTPLGAKTIRAFTWGASLLPDNFGFASSPFYGIGGFGWYGYMDYMACYAGTVLTARQVTGLTNWLLAHP